jgi:hypothetical protein
MEGPVPTGASGAASGTLDSWRTTTGRDADGRPALLLDERGDVVARVGDAMSVGGGLTGAVDRWAGHPCATAEPWAAGDVSVLSAHDD